MQKHIEECANILYSFLCCHCTHMCCYFAVSPHPFSFSRLLCSFQTSFIKYFSTHLLLLSLHYDERRHFCVWGISEWKLENSTRLTRDFCRFSNKKSSLVKVIALWCCNVGHTRSFSFKLNGKVYNLLSKFVCGSI